MRTLVYLEGANALCLVALKEFLDLQRVELGIRTSAQLTTTKFSEYLAQGMC